MFKKMLLGSGLFSAILVSGCIDTKTEVTVKKDGTGTVVETTYLSLAAAEMMQGMESVNLTEVQDGKASAPAEKEKPSNPLLDKRKIEKYKQKCAKMGEGVTFVSAEDLKKQDGSPGVKVTYSFNDVNKLKVSPNKGDSKAKPGKNEEVIAFNLSKANGASKLTVTLPKKEDNKETQKPNKPEDPNGLAMAKQMFAGLHIALSVKVDGKITNTTATYKEENQDVTLLDFKIDDVFKDEANAKKVMGSGENDSGIFGSADLLKKVPGVKIETKDKIEIEFN
jgi:hypothetical protein